MTKEIKAKVEIIDNQIERYYEMRICYWRKRKWYSRRESWVHEMSSYVGYNARSPRIAKGIQTSKEYFEEDYKSYLSLCRFLDITEVHTIIIQDKL